MKVKTLQLNKNKGSIYIYTYTYTYPQPSHTTYPMPICIPIYLHLPITAIPYHISHAIYIPIYVHLSLPLPLSHTATLYTLITQYTYPFHINNRIYIPSTPTPFHIPHTYLYTVRKLPTPYPTPIPSPTPYTYPCWVKSRLPNISTYAWWDWNAKTDSRNHQNLARNWIKIQTQCNWWDPKWVFHIFNQESYIWIDNNNPPENPVQLKRHQIFATVIIISSLLLLRLEFLALHPACSLFDGLLPQNIH